MYKKNTTKLPYTVTTDTLTKINFLFDLSVNTKSPITVHQLLDIVLTNITQETRISQISNGDILQSLAMALAVRMKMIAADDALVEKMVMELVLKALKAAKKASITEVSKGNA